MKSKLIDRGNGTLKLVESKQLRKGCIGRLEGVCADFMNPTRNERLYGLKLWEKVFSNELFLEAIKTKTAFGELDHPEDRFEVLSKLACVVMTDYNIDKENGVVTGGFDILDTSQGRILKSLLDYGCQMGVSSRGTGDIIETENGDEVDPETYEFSCFDVVSTPAVMKARQTYTESVKQRNKRNLLTESIKSEISNCNSDIELNAIENTISNAKVPNIHSLFECIEDKRNSILEGKTISSKQAQKSNNIAEGSKTTNSVKTINETVNRKTFKQMAEALRDLNSKVNAYKIREQNLNKIISSQNSQIDEYKALIERCNKKLSATNKAKNAVEEKLTESKSNISKLTTENRKLRSDIRNNDKNDDVINSLSEEVTTTKQLNTKLKQQVKSLNEKVNNLVNQINSLRNQLDESNDTIEDYKYKNDTLNEKINDNSEQYVNKLERANAQITNLMKENTEKAQTIIDLENQLADIQEANDSLTEKCNRIAKHNKSLQSINSNYFNNYLNEYANKQGIDTDSVKSLLKENATVDDVKRVVDNIRDKQDRYNKLPISYSKPATINVLNESISTNGDDSDTDTLNFLTAVKNSL